MTIVFNIPEVRFNRLAQRLTRVASRASKFGLPVPQMHVLSRYGNTYEVYDALAKIRGAESNTRMISLPMVRVQLEGFSPDIGAWKIVGYRSERKLADDRYVQYNSGFVPEAKKGESLCCDHCGFKRKRRTTFIVQKADSGETVEVGSGCSEAFFGFAGGTGLAEGLIETGSILHEAEEVSRQDFLKMGFDMEEEVHAVLAVANRRVADFGFVSSSTANYSGENATWRDVYNDLVAYRRDDLENEEIFVTAADFMAAEEVIAAYSGEVTSSFGYAVQDTIKRGLAGVKDVALLTAAAHVYQEEIRKNVTRGREQDMAALSKHVGDLGARIDFLGKVYRVNTYDGQWGRTFFITMFNPDGDMLHWKTSTEPGLREGDAYELKGTIKAHRKCDKGPFSGANETVVTRVSILAELGPATFGAPGDKNELTEEDDEALDSFLMTRM